MVTPFDKHDELDVKGIKTLVDISLQAGVSGIFVAGSIGEFWALTNDERKKLFMATIDAVNGKVPVFCGTAAEATKKTIELTKIAKDVGADAATVLTPYYVKPNSAELVDHFLKVQQSVDIPICLYNNPARTGGVNIDSNSLEKIAQASDMFVGIKNSSSDQNLTYEYIMKAGKKMSVLAGNDTSMFDCLKCGGKGGIVAWSNVLPKPYADTYKYFLAGEDKKAIEAQFSVMPIRNFAGNLGTFPAVIKEAMDLLGLPAGHPREPVRPLTSEAREKLRSIMKNEGLKIVK